MSSITFLFIFVTVLTSLFLVLNFALAPHNPYQEKYSIFECGFHSFLGQNRTQFGVKFFIFASKIKANGLLLIEQLLESFSE